MRYKLVLSHRRIPHKKMAVEEAAVPLIEAMHEKMRGILATIVAAAATHTAAAAAAGHCAAPPPPLPREIIRTVLCPEIIRPVLIHNII